MLEDFATYVAGERERLNRDRDSVLRQRAMLEDQLEEIDREFAAVAAYEMAKTGKTEKPQKNGAAPRARRGNRREAVISALRAAPLGLRRAELLSALGVVDDDKGAMSVSNALTALQSTGQIRRNSDGRWQANEETAQAA